MPLRTYGRRSLSYSINYNISSSLSSTMLLTPRLSMFLSRIHISSLHPSHSLRTTIIPLLLSSSSRSLLGRTRLMIRPALVTSNHNPQTTSKIAFEE